MEKNKDETTQTECGKVIKEFESVRSYKRAMGFEADWATYIDFAEDRQWKTTDKNKNMPKPMHNIIKFAKKAKTSAILSDNIKMVFSPLEQVEETDIAAEAAEMINKAAQSTLEEIEQDRIDNEVVNDAFCLGTGIVHYYWDNKKVGGYKTKYIGEICGEVIDPMNAFPGNPQCTDKDKQPYWIITYRDMVSNVKSEAKKNGAKIEDINLISADKDTAQETYEASRHEVSEGEKITVYVKYWRDTEDNKIYFMKCTKGAVIKEKTALWDYNGTELEPYPLAIFNWEDRKKCIFGLGEIEGMIYNQKAINFVESMKILNVQDTGWSKYLVKPDALKQKIQNVPGEVITDHNSNPNIDGIKVMTPATMSPQVSQVQNDLITNTRIFNGVSETVSGEKIGTNIAASAIIALQNQAKVPLDAIRKKYYRYRRDVGKLLEFFFKTKYNLPRMIKSEDEMGNEESVQFQGTKYQEIPLKLKIDVGAGSTFSESLATATLDKFLDKGFITPEQYAMLASDNVMPFKEQFKKMKEEERQQQMMMQQQQEQSQLAQATKALQQQQATIQKLQQQLGGGQNAMQQMPMPTQM